jgi:hypothetical protein
VTRVAVGKAGKLYLTGLINLAIKLRLSDDSDHGAHGGAGGGALELSTQDEHAVYSSEKRQAVLERFLIPLELTVALEA